MSHPIHWNIWKLLICKMDTITLLKIHLIVLFIHSLVNWIRLCNCHLIHLILQDLLLALSKLLAFLYRSTSSSFSSSSSPPLYHPDTSSSPLQSNGLLALARSMQLSLSLLLFFFLSYFYLHSINCQVNPVLFIRDQLSLSKFMYHLGCVRRKQGKKETCKIWRPMEAMSMAPLQMDRERLLCLLKD